MEPEIYTLKTTRPTNGRREILGKCDYCQCCDAVTRPATLSPRARTSLASLANGLHLQTDCTCKRTSLVTGLYFQTVAVWYERTSRQQLDQCIQVRYSLKRRSIYRIGAYGYDVGPFVKGDIHDRKFTANDEDTVGCHCC